jgi:adenylate cyclase
VQEKEDFKLSMGVHVSEILFTEKDIFGDGVNVASRIANLAGANEIWFSTTVFENIRNREELEIENIGPQQLKNVVYDVNLYKIVT